MHKIIRRLMKPTIFVMLLVMINIQTTHAATNYWATPAVVTKVTPELLSELIDLRADGDTQITERINGTNTTYTPARETYHPNDRRWQGLPSFAVTGNRFWAVWYTGGNGEPRQLNYLVVAYSDDFGETWVDPFLVIDHPDPNHDGVNLGVPNFFIDADGKLSLIWIQYYTWIVKFDNADAPSIDDVTWSEPAIYTSSKIHKPPTVFTDADGSEALILASEFEAGDTHTEVTRFYVSKNNGTTWSLRANLNSSVPNNRMYPESQVVELSEGNLLVMSRIEGGAAGGIEISRSSDYGQTWSAYQNNLVQPFIGPGSKFHVMKLSSNNILIINHSTTSSREQLVAYLSTDNGETFPYQLDIDTRTSVTYPYAIEHDGKIYVTWDKGRFNHKEIRFAVITETDIINGFYADSSQKLGIISKLNAQYKEIVSINSAFENKLIFPVGTTSASIRESLPTEITVTDNQDNEYVLTGSWRNPGYYQDIPGTYTFSFDTTLPLNVEDTYGYLQISVVLESGDDAFDFDIIVYSAAGVVIVIGAATTTVFFIKRKKIIK